MVISALKAVALTAAFVAFCLMGVGVYALFDVLVPGEPGTPAKGALGTVCSVFTVAVAIASFVFFYVESKQK